MKQIRLALYQPEIAANVGAAIRNAACFGADLHVIDPCGFPWKEREIARVAMDYRDLSPPQRHLNWEQFRKDVPGRIILLTTAADISIYDVTYSPEDILLMGTESAGVPELIHNSANVRCKIPLSPAARSLNVGVAGAIALSAVRQQIGYP